MINKVNGIINKSKREGEDIILGSNEYKELVIYLNPIAKQFASMLAECGNIKSDVVKIKGDKFWGLRANIVLNKDEQINRSKVEQRIMELEILPSLVIFNDLDVDLFFTPNKVINLVHEKDYLELVFSFIEFIQKNEHIGLKFIGWNLENTDLIKCNELEGIDTVFSKEMFDQSRCVIEYIGEEEIDI